MRRIVALMLLSVLPLSVYPKEEIEGVRFHYVGLFEFENETSKFPVISRREGSSGSETLQFTALKETTAVPAVVGTDFGVYYSVVGSPVGRQVRVREVVRFPAPGRQIGEKIYMGQETTAKMKIGRGKLLAFSFDDEATILEGLWTVEVWIDDQLMARQLFEVTDAGAAIMTAEERAAGRGAAVCKRSRRRTVSTYVPERACMPQRVWEELQDKHVFGRD